MSEIIVGMFKNESPDRKRKTDLLDVGVNVETYDQEKVDLMHEITKKLRTKLESAFEYLYLDPKCELTEVELHKYIHGGGHDAFFITNCPIKARPLMLALVAALARPLGVRISIA